jgi:hypothetical protein
MATTPNSVITAQTPKNGKVQIANGDASAQKTVYTGGANASKIVSLILQSTDTSARDVQVSITNGGTSYPIGTVTVPIGAGNSGSVPSVNALNNTQIPGLPLDSDGNPYILLASASDTLTVSALTTVTSGKLITANAVAAGDF